MMGRRDQRRVALQRAADGDVRRRQARTVARHAASALHRKQRAKQTAPTRSEAKDPIAHRLWEIEIGENARAGRDVAAASEENRAPPASRRSRAFRAVIVGVQTRKTTGAEENDQEEARQGFLTSTRVAIDADAPSSERFHTAPVQKIHVSSHRRARPPSLAPRSRRRASRIRSLARPISTRRVVVSRVPVPVPVPRAAHARARDRRHGSRERARKLRHAHARRRQGRDESPRVRSRDGTTRRESFDECIEMTRAFGAPARTTRV